MLRSSVVSGYVTAAGRRRCQADDLDDGPYEGRRASSYRRSDTAGRPPRTMRTRWDERSRDVNGRRPGRKEQ
ncbi:unnamed protein product [Macrosiphum euphorbiae]|uniref:Uncharacterized protein n=1 Tax=Macrosiphum euphorbiae TaxID=13131 RepID=A0AAV0XKI4_9HEMI|nr:unnamed protein product [Macrosiphum euphorbiae]